MWILLQPLRRGWRSLQSLGEVPKWSRRASNYRGPVTPSVLCSLSPPSDIRAAQRMKTLPPNSIRRPLHSTALASLAP